MEKKQIVRFLKEKKRGVYTLLVRMYADCITSMAITMALEIIKEDLEKETGENVKLNYFSLAQAISKFKKQAVSRVNGTAKKFEFRDANEIRDNQTAPGKFKID